MKKILSQLVLFITSFTIVNAASVVTAQYFQDPVSGLGNGMSQLILLIESLLAPLFGAILGGTGDLLFERILFLVVILTVVYIAISRIPIFEGDKNKAIRWIIAVSISLLSTRFLVESNLVQTMILPYSVLGVSLTAFLPLLIYFYFVQSFRDSSTVRKILWIFFIVVYLGIWGSRYDELGRLSWIYFWTGVLAFLFLFFDGTIRRAIIKQQYGQLDLQGRLRTAAKLDHELDQLERDYSKNRYPKNVYMSMRKNLVDQIKRLRKG